jgi:hypothetical protein
VGNTAEFLAGHFRMSAEENETEKRNEQMPSKKQESTFGSTEKFETDAAPEQNEVAVAVADKMKRLYFDLKFTMKP